jgi:UDP-N-acetyl-D-glucosamine dehydrogenase
MRHYDVPRLASEPLTPDYLSSLDCVLIATDHSAYDYDFIVQYAPLVVDTRNATKNVTHGRHKIWKA